MNITNEEVESWHLKHFQGASPLSIRGPQSCKIAARWFGASWVRIMKA